MVEDGIAPHAKRQWGHDKRTVLAVIPPPISDRRVALGRLAMIVTVVAWIGYLVTWIFDDLLNRSELSAVAGTESVVYLLIVTTLTASTVAYLMSRLGFFYRSRSHHRASRGLLDQFYADGSPSLTVLVPSYQEDARVVRNTLLSAALQEYQGMRIVLLIDDPPVPRSRAAFDLLRGAQQLPGQVQGMLAEPSLRFEEARIRFETKTAGAEQIGPDDLDCLVGEYDAASGWLEELAASQEIVDHTDVFLVERVIGGLINDLKLTSDSLRAAIDEEAWIPASRALHLYQRLNRIFDAELSWFQRKQYVSLSHEPNKAMNLNSYMGLMGSRHREVQTVKGPALVPVRSGAADLEVPDPDYVVTLDADSVLLPEYCLRLVQLLEQAEYRGVAIAQTPYSAFPGSATRLERMAGATTDLQHIVHQGLTYYNGTFWVGANAVIRKAALDDIAVSSYIGDYEIKTFIKDRTVIEDTESTIDMGIHDWRLFNVPERLSYSATPPDFGSLCIQRRRWATGGLILLARLRHQTKARKARGQSTRFGETFLRWNYMASISWSSVSLLILLAFPFDATLISPWLFLVALPYFFAMGSDLRYCGYKWTDTIRIYGFNLILLPVNLAGVTATLSQILTSSKAAFARTPKVRDRTVTPAFYLIAPFVLTALAAVTFLYAYDHSRRENMIYAALNVLLSLYAIVAFIGLWNCVVDLGVHLRQLLSTPVDPAPKRRRRRHRAPAPVTELLDWRMVLQLGPEGEASPWSSPSELFVRDPLAAQTDFKTVFQPVVDLSTSRVVGYEALSRFDDESSTPQRLADADQAGQRHQLEIEMVGSALRASRSLPSGVWVAVKTSSDALTARLSLLDELGREERDFLVEVSQREEDDPAKEIALLRRLLPPNARVTLEHATLDRATLSLLIEAQPSYLKLDREAISGIAGDPSRQVQLTTLLQLAEQQGCRVIAFGIEDPADTSVLLDRGVYLGQGYALGVPRDVPYATS